jgi:hypothetical protein
MAHRIEPLTAGKTMTRRASGSVEHTPIRGAAEYDKPTRTAQPDDANAKPHFTRRTNTFSKKREKHEVMFAHFAAWYNFCRRHQTLKTTPAISAGLVTEAWTIERLFAESAKSHAG